MGRTLVRQVRSSEKKPFFSYFFLSFFSIFSSYFYPFFYFFSFFYFSYFLFISFYLFFLLFFFILFFQLFFFFFFIYFFFIFFYFFLRTPNLPGFGVRRKELAFLLTFQTMVWPGSFARVRRLEKGTGLSPYSEPAEPGRAEPWFLLQTPNLPGLGVRRKELAFLQTPNLLNQGYTRSFSELKLRTRGKNTILDRLVINKRFRKHNENNTVQNILLEGLNRFHGAPTSPLVQMWIKGMFSTPYKRLI